MHQKTRLALLVSGALLIASGQAAAQNISSTYEKFNFDDCALVEEGERHVTRVCNMRKGPDLMIVYHEHGVIVMVEPAGSEKLYEAQNPSYKQARTGHFGELFTRNGLTTLEWRVERVAGEWQPYAAIYRTTYSEPVNDGSMRNRQRLDVLKFGSDHACQIGTVEANVANHNVRAREIADAARGTNPCPGING
ncbi:MAG: hypothetical protein AAF441_15745 [Pseudomonadota bacterium]